MAGPEREHEPLRGHGWLLDSLIGPAGCLTVVRGGDVADVARAFGGTLGTDAPVAQLSELGAVGPDDDVVALARRDDWVLAVENNGWQGSRPEVLRAASRDGVAASVYWSVNADTRFTLAEGGRVVTCFEGNAPTRRSGADPDRWGEQIASLSWADGDWVASMVTLLGQVTRLEPDPNWLSPPFHLVGITPRAQEVAGAADLAVAPTDLDLADLTYDDPVLAYHLRRAEAASARAVARLAVERSVSLAGLSEDPDVAQALSHEPPTPTPALDRISQRALAACRRAQDKTRPLQRYFAIEALLASTAADPWRAAFAAVSAARRCRQVGRQAGGASLRDALLDRLGHPAAPSGSLGLRVPQEVPEPRRHEWITRHWLGPVGGLLLVADPDPVEVIRRLGGSPESARTALPTLSSGPVVAVRADGAWTVVTDVGQGAELLAPFLQPGPGVPDAILATWQARGRVQVRSVRRGQLHAHLDPQRPEHLADTEGLLDTYLGDITLPLPGAGALEHVPVVLTLLERLTGTDLGPAALDLPHLQVRLPDARPPGAEQRW